MDTSDYRRRIAACFPDLAVRQIVPVLAGWDNVLLEVDDRWMFRFPRYPEGEKSLRKEIALLQAIAPSLPLSVPQYSRIADGGVGGGLFAGYRKIPGAPLTCTAWQSAPQAYLARQLADFLSALHRIPVAQAVAAGLDEADAGRWRQEYIALYAEIAVDILPRLDAATRQRAMQLWQSALDDAGFFAFCPSLVHRDFMAGNILYDPVQGAITGIIDWGDATVGDPAIDFAGLLYDVGHDAVQRILAAYQRPVDARFQERIAFYTQIVPFHGLRYALFTGDEAEWQRQITALQHMLRDCFTARACAVKMIGSGRRHRPACGRNAPAH